MHLPLALLAASAFPLYALARPHVARQESGVDCGDSKRFYDATPEKWDAANTDEWLNNWWTKHQSEVESMGFAKAFTRAALGSNDLTCQLSGREKNCVGDMDTCSNKRFAALSPEDMEPAYYVLSSIDRLHGYIKGYQETLQTSAVVQSFSHDYYTQLFFIDPKMMDNRGFREMINALVTVLLVGAGGVAYTLGKAGAAYIAAGSTMAGGGLTESILRSGDVPADSFGASANSGYVIAKALSDTFTSLFSLNNNLMQGKEIKHDGFPKKNIPPSNQGDLRQFLKGGRWVNAQEMSKVEGLPTMAAILQSIQINALWRQQPVFLMGGLPCGNTELGPTPMDQEGGVGWCDTRLDQAWYLYHYKKERGGYLDRPYGSDRLGADPYLSHQYDDVAAEFPNIEVADAIRSSIKSYWIAENNYDAEKFTSRITDIVADGNNPISEMSSLEGLWTIPVCDVSAMLNVDWDSRKRTLMSYGESAKPQWCGNICGDSEEKTKVFLERIHVTDTNKYQWNKNCDGKGNNWDY